MLPVLQIVLLFITTYLFFLGVSNPNAASPKDYVANEGVIGFVMVAIGPRFSKLIILISTIYQMIYLFAQISPKHLSNFLFSFITTTDNPDLLPINFLAIIGFALMIIGGLGRIWCYHTLGKFFTYEITIRNSHQLIKTGPYAYVRHPSYTFVSMVTIGMFLVHRRIANLLPNNPWIQMQFGPGGFCICCLILAASIARRVGREEKELKKQFGSEWLKYASTRKRFIPGLI
jgi:protein-S-isoprenylcysteine O-methyltransferase Ste14